MLFWAVSYAAKYELSLLKAEEAKIHKLIMKKQWDIFAKK
jgi:hypothetical protein